jgi:ribosomal-protein-alanine N-acetyltransferase
MASSCFVRGTTATLRSSSRRVQATVEPCNAASQRVLEKLGFQREGLLRSYTSYRGERGDVYLYSLLAADLG